MSLIEAMRKFPDDATAEQWFIETRWSDGAYCPHCGSLNVQSGASHKTMPFRCRDCRKRFSVRTGTAMESSNLGYQVWAIALYQLTTSLKSVSSMKLHRDLDITQKSAWFLAQRIRETWANDVAPFSGPVEVDESYFGGRRRNMPKSKRKELKGRGAVGKTAVVGAKDRATNKVSAAVAEATDAETLQGFVADRVEGEATVYTDDASAYDGLPHDHDSVRHSVGEYVRGDVHTNGIESFWSMLKRAHKGTFHKISPKHLQRYVNEFAGKHNSRDQDTIDQMESMVAGMVGKRLSYRDLVAD